MESDDPAVAAMHLTYAATFDPYVYVRCAPRAGCPRSGHHVFHGAPAAARAATCEFCSPPPPTAPPPGVALPASAAGVRALQRQYASAAASAAHDAALAATARSVVRYQRRLPQDAPYAAAGPAVVRKLAERRVRLWEARNAVRAGFSVCGMQQLWRESRDGSEIHNYQMEAGELPTTTSRSARRRKHRRSARARAASAEAAEGGADVAADGVPPAVVDAHRRAAKLAVVQELRRARRALENADLGTVSDAAAALPALDALHPPPAATGPEYSPPEEPPDMQRAPPSWGGNADEVRRWGEDHPRVLRREPRLSTGHVDWWRREHIRDLDVPSWRPWVNRCLADRCHSRTAAFLASGTVSSLHKDDPAAREERGKSGEPLRVPVRPLGVGSVLVRVASAHALVQVGADAREVLGPVQHSFQSGAGRETAYISMRVSLQLFGGRGTDWLPQPHDAAVVELDPFLEAVDAANISAAFSLLGVDACDQSTPRMEAAIVQKSMPADFGGLNMALMQYEAPAALYSAQSVVMPKMSNDPRWCTPRIAATEAEQGKLAADRASSAPVQGVDRYYPFVVEDRNRLGKSALTVVYIFAVLTLLDMAEYDA
eukprot:jgi/Tetstr1/421394/TSEL_001162.t1